MTTMKAARLHGIRDLRVDLIDVPQPGPGEILLKVQACSICGSDIRILNSGNDRVKYPAIIGHEIAGEVAAVGAGIRHVKPGHKLAIGADVPSMQDEWSRNGMANLSDINYAIGHQFPGGFAEYCLLNEMTVNFGPVTPIPANVSYAAASLAEPLACCINGLERAFMEPAKTVFIIGAGSIGILLAWTAAAFGASIVVIADQDEQRLEQARQLGLSHVFDSRMHTYPQIDRLFTKLRQGFDVVLTACSSPEAQEKAVEIVAKRGVVNFFGGLPGNAGPISLLSNLIHYREAYLTGSHGSTPRQHRMAMQLIEAGQIPVEKLVSHRYSLDNIDRGFAMAESRKGLKIVICPGGE